MIYNTYLYLLALFPRRVQTLFCHQSQGWQHCHLSENFFCTRCHLLESHTPHKTRSGQRKEQMIEDLHIVLLTVWRHNTRGHLGYLDWKWNAQSWDIVHLVPFAVSHQSPFGVSVIQVTTLTPTVSLTRWSYPGRDTEHPGGKDDDHWQQHAEADGQLS